MFRGCCQALYTLVNVGRVFYLGCIFICKYYAVYYCISNYFSVYVSAVTLRITKPLLSIGGHYGSTTISTA